MPSPALLRQKFLGLQVRWEAAPKGSKERVRLGRALDLSYHRWRQAARPPKPPAAPRPEPVTVPPPVTPQLTAAAFALIHRYDARPVPQPKEPHLTAYAFQLVRAADYPRDPSQDAVLAAHRVLLEARVDGLAAELSTY